MHDFAQQVSEGMRVRSADGQVVGHAAFQRGGFVVVKGDELRRDLVLRDDDVDSVTGDEIHLTRSASQVSDDSGGDWDDTGARVTDWASEGGVHGRDPS